MYCKSMTSGLQNEMGNKMAMILLFFREKFPHICIFFTYIFQRGIKMIYPNNCFCPSNIVRPKGHAEPFDQNP